MLEVIVLILKFSLPIWLCALGYVVFREVFLTRESLKGLLGTGVGCGTDPERVTLLVFTIGFAGYYVLTSVSKLPEIIEANAMLDVPQEALIALFGAQSSYVLGKLLRFYGGKII